MEAIAKSTIVASENNNSLKNNQLQITYKKAPNSNLRNVNFDIIRYANCWEDAELLIESLKPIAGERVLSVGSGGDNSFALLAHNPSVVTAIDINQVQLFVIELKKQAIKHLSYTGFLEFVGFRHSATRRQYFNFLSPYLSLPCQSYWETNFDIIHKGLIYSGKFEKYLLAFGRKILPLVVGKKNMKKFFDIKTAEEQADFYNKQWNNLRWRTMFKLFFSKWIMGRFGRSPQFLNEVQMNVGEFILNKTENHLRNVKSQQNEFLHFIITGEFNELLPYYARPENFENVKKNIDRLMLHHGYIEELFAENMHFDCYNLSNIFEYMDEDYFRSLSENIAHSLKKGDRVAYWNLMVHRRLSDSLPNDFEYQQDMSERLTEVDKGFFYKNFNLDIKK